MHNACKETCGIGVLKMVVSMKVFESARVSESGGEGKLLSPICWFSVYFVEGAWNVIWNEGLL